MLSKRTRKNALRNFVWLFGPARAEQINKGQKKKRKDPLAQAHIFKQFIRIWLTATTPSVSILEHIAPRSVVLCWWRDTLAVGLNIFKMQKGSLSAYERKRDWLEEKNGENTLFWVEILLETRPVSNEV